MTNVLKGMIAGFVGTVVLSMLMIAKSMMGIMPQLDVIGMLSGMMSVSAAMGWIIHFLIGTIIWGGGFAVINGLIPGGNQVVKGIIFGIFAWLIMMVAIMPMAGAGFLGLNLGIMAPIMTMMLHVIFGAVMGVVYGNSENGRRES